MQQTQACSYKQVEFEEIDCLRQRLITSEDRLSTSEEQIRQMNSRFQAFIGAVLHYLSPPVATAAQNIWQQDDHQQTQQQQHDHQHTEQQNEKSQGDQHNEY